MFVTIFISFISSPDAKNTFRKFENEWREIGKKKVENFCLIGKLKPLICVPAATIV